MIPEITEAVLSSSGHTLYSSQSSSPSCPTPAFFTILHSSLSNPQFHLSYLHCIIDTTIKIKLLIEAYLAYAVLTEPRTSPAAWPVSLLFERTMDATIPPEPSILYGGSLQSDYGHVLTDHGVAPRSVPGGGVRAVPGSSRWPAATDPFLGPLQGGRWPCSRPYAVPSQFETRGPVSVDCGRDRIAVSAGQPIGRGDSRRFAVQVELFHSI